MNIEEQSARLKGSLLLFTKVFFKLRTGMDFIVSEPTSREPHSVTICKALTSAVRCDLNRLLINIPPGYAKTELLMHAIAWGLAINPKSQSIYTSYSHTLAKKSTQIIRQIINMREFHMYFDCRMSKSSSAKDDFMTEQGGSVYGTGLHGTLTGLNSGINGYDGYGGLFIVDDPIKPNDATSPTVRDSTWDILQNTVQSRLRNPAVTPLIICGQRTYEDDPSGRIIEEDTDNKWSKTIIPALDVHNHAIDPRLHTTEMLLEMKAKNAFVFYSQYQQNPQPAGGSLFSVDSFRILPEEPKIIATFITADTAETDKNYNDATVFSFWGLYKIEYNGQETDHYGLHWLDCLETRVEPKDLESAFMDFYSDCMRHSVKPKVAAIEKKSTGTYLNSLLRDMPGLRLLPLNRGRDPDTGAIMSKTRRFLNSQPYINDKLISLPEYGSHTKNCIEHMSKITNNDTHRFDDIADTCADAIAVAFIDKTLVTTYTSNEKDKDSILSEVAKMNDQSDSMGFNPYGIY